MKILKALWRILNCRIEFPCDEAQGLPCGPW